ncbi:septum formation family protein [Homoserinimonas sp. A447]
MLLATATTGAILAFGLTGCALVTQVTDAAQGKKDVFSIQVGDCMNDDDSEATEVTAVRDASCDDLHDNEVYLTWEFDADEFPAGTAYPGDETVSGDADNGCFADFGSWIGAPYEETSLNYFPYYPSEQSWDQGDREVVCLAFDMNGPVTGSLEGKGAEYPYLG